VKRNGSAALRSSAPCRPAPPSVIITIIIIIPAAAARTSVRLASSSMYMKPFWMKDTRAPKGTALASTSTRDTLLSAAKTKAACVKPAGRGGAGSGGDQGGDGGEPAPVNVAPACLLRGGADR
jgi:hypothetical protein